MGAQSLLLITPPVSEPVLLADAKLFARIETTADDALITSLITAARLRAEELFDRAFLTQVWDLFLDNFPRSLDGLDLPIAMPRWPLQSVTSINFTPYGKPEQLLDPSQYTVDVGGPGRGRVVPNSPLLGTFIYAGFGLWPTDQLIAARGVRIRFTAGYTAAGNVPGSMIQHLQQVITNWYQYRDSNQGVPAEVDALMANEQGVPFCA